MLELYISHIEKISIVEKNLITFFVCFAFANACAEALNISENYHEEYYFYEQALNECTRYFN